MRKLFALVAGIALTAAPTVHAQNLDLSVVPPVLGPGDSGTVTMIGTPGDLAFLLTSLDPGPLTLPIVGQVEVGTFGLDYVVFGPLPANGLAQFPCTIPCTLTMPVYMQGLTIAGSPLQLTGKSDQVILGVDPNIITDCDGNGIDDNCDPDITDCDGNGMPDSCDIASGAADDNDNDGMPDSCCPDICSMEAQFTFDGPLPPKPFLLSVNIIVPGVASAAGNLFSISLDEDLPTSVTSPNGQVVASDFQYVGSGLTFKVTYTPDAGASEFGTGIWLLSEAEGHCEKRTISGGQRTRCELLSGPTFQSTYDQGSVEILTTLNACP